jgi:16S rRNA processing protein RimM
LLPDGTRLGSIAGVLQMPAHDVLVVRGGGREYLIPAVEAIVKEVDLEAGRVRIDPPAGLLEL